MYLSTLNIWNFRKYGRGEGEFANASPGLVVNFQNGLNVLIGENDSGKTAVIDAIRYVLRTQSGEYIPIEEKDFHCDDKGNRAEELRIECIFEGLSEQEQGLFLEWLSLNDKKDFQLKVCLYAKRQDNSIFPQFYAGARDGTTMDAGARMLLRSVYLKPLRDALTDMTHGYKSRLAQILGAHSVFKTQRDEFGQPITHDIENRYRILRDEIERYFTGDEAGSVISNAINDLLSNHFLFDDRTAQIKLAGGELSEILHQLDLVLEGNKSGLGTLNLLCIAAEMLMLQEQQKGLKLVLIEELEAHLHPQYQMNLIDYIKEVSSKGTQFILSTHSITIGSKLPLESLIVFRGNEVYPMGTQYTQLASSDYLFLERFLDATKANLFFARGLIIVEGDAENLLLPAIAEAIGRPLNKYGVSIVNVGSTAYKRYAKIFLRKDEKIFDMPVSIITDMDIPSLSYLTRQESGKSIWTKDQVFEEIKTEQPDFPNEQIPICFRTKEKLKDWLKSKGFSTSGINRVSSKFTKDNKKPATQDMLDYLRRDKKESLEIKYNDGKTKIFLPQNWTLEYEIAKSKLAHVLDISVNAAKLEQTDNVADIDSLLKKAKENIKSKWDSISDEISDEFAYDIFKPLNDKEVSKAATAQYLAELLSPRRKDVLNEHKENILKKITDSPTLSYLVEAINHATGKN